MNDFKYFANFYQVFKCTNVSIKQHFFNKCALTYSLSLRCANDFVISHIYAKSLGKSLKNVIYSTSAVPIRSRLNAWTPVLLIARARSEHVLFVAD